jgi:L-alanine-DL-glutamate epimerase-like enolase superfamily enzyme
MSVHPVQLEMYRTSIPMRRFEHAAAGRDVAEAVIVRVQFSDGGSGWGETLPREYVTGETIDTVVADISETVWPAAVRADFGDARAALEAIPRAGGGGRCLNAAACAIELACVDWLLGRRGDGALAELAGGRTPTPTIDARVGGVLGAADPARTARRLRLMRWLGLRDFKLKLGLGDDVDEENLRLVERRIGRAVAAGRCTFRVDVNGAWDADTTAERAAALKRLGVCVIEQPATCAAGELAAIARRCELPLMADESLLTDRDAAEMREEPRRLWWNIRISKNGGLTRAMALAATAAECGATVAVGCMVGESSILSAAQRRLLQVAGGVRFVEGNYGRFLLTDDLTVRSLRFGYGGRLKPPAAPGLGVTVDASKLARYAAPIRTLRA